MGRKVGLNARRSPRCRLEFVGIDIRGREEGEVVLVFPRAGAFVKAFHPSKGACKAGRAG